MFLIVITVKNNNNINNNVYVITNLSVIYCNGFEPRINITV